LQSAGPVLELAAGVERDPEGKRGDDRERDPFGDAAGPRETLRPVTPRCTLRLALPSPHF